MRHQSSFIQVIIEEDPNYVFPEMKLRGLVPNFHIHVSVSASYIPTIGLLQQVSFITILKP
jgi:hypothetical protein